MPNRTHPLFFLLLLALPSCQPARLSSYSGNGYFFHVYKDSNFRFNHAWDIGHDQVNIYITGQCYRRMDTLFLVKKSDNSDSLQLRGRKLKYPDIHFLLIRGNELEILTVYGDWYRLKR